MTFEEWWEGWRDPNVGRVENGIQCDAAFHAWNAAKAQSIAHTIKACAAAKAEGAREEREAYQSAYGQGYIEGQKAMRERAADVCETAKGSTIWKECGKACGEEIRALPIEGE